MNLNSFSAMKEYCAKRKGETQWEKVFKARDIESAARDFVRGNEIIQPLDEILLVENVAFGNSEKASFLAHELEMRAGWAEVLEAQEEQSSIDAPTHSETESFKENEVGYENEASIYLTRVREESGYRLLRKVISDVSLLLIILSIAGCFVSIGRVTNTFGSSGWAIMEILKDCFLWIILILIVSKVCTVLIDIADLLIEKNRQTRK